MMDLSKSTIKSVDGFYLKGKHELQNKESNAL